MQISKVISSKKIQKETSWIIIGQIGTAIAGLLGVKLLTSVLGPGEFGKLSLANTIITLISANFLFGPLGQGLMRFWAISRTENNLELFYIISNQLKQYVIAISAVVGAVLVLIVTLTKGQEWGSLIAVATAVGILSGWFGLRIAVITAARKRSLAASLNISNALFKPIIAVIFVLVISVNAFWAMSGYLVVSLLLLLFMELIYSNFVKQTTDQMSALDNSTTTKIKKDIITFSWPFALWGSFNWIYVSCDKWALQAFHGNEVVGAYAVVSQLAIYPLIFGSAFLSTLIVPVAYERAGDLSQHKKVMSAYKLLALITGIYIIGLLVLMLVYYIFHYKLILLISTTDFAQSSFLLPWLTGAWGLFYLGQVLSNFGMVANKSHVYIAPKIAAAAVAGISTFYFSATYGVIGVVWGLVLAGFVYSFWCFVIAVSLVGHTRAKI